MAWATEWLEYACSGTITGLLDQQAEWRFRFHVDGAFEGTIKPAAGEQDVFTVQPDGHASFDYVASDLQLAVHAHSCAFAIHRRSAADQSERVARLVAKFQSKSGVTGFWWWTGESQRTAFSLPVAEGSLTEEPLFTGCYMLAGKRVTDDGKELPTVARLKFHLDGRVEGTQIHADDEQEFHAEHALRGSWEGLNAKFDVDDASWGLSYRYEGALQGRAFTGTWQAQPQEGDDTAADKAQRGTFAYDLVRMLDWDQYQWRFISSEGHY